MERPTKSVHFRVEKSVWLDAKRNFPEHGQVGRLLRRFVHLLARHPGKAEEALRELEVRR
ncbi:MAG: hypothetical protein DRG33_08060 [Deltaproteobacteria bacterium]|nr:MAG: hypothetical protein DRG33_08060 [Deltaproteobacteria bacterium]